MSRLKQLQARQGAIVAEMEAILDGAEDGQITEEQQTTYDGLESELAKQIEPALARENQLQDRIRSLVPTARTPDEGFNPGKSKVSNPKPAWEDDPKKGFKTSQEFFSAILTSAERGRVDDERLKFMAAVGSDEAGRYADPYGGFLVPEGFSPNLLSLANEIDPLASRVTRIPMATNKVTIPARTDKDHSSSVSGGLRVYRRSETQAVTASRMVVEQVSLEATPLMGLSYATEELIRDSAISFTALLDAGFRDEFASKILYERIHGTGAGTLEGVLNTDCLISITKETGQAADTIVYENLIKARARCWRYGQAVWLYNHDCLPQLQQLYMAIGTGGVAMWQNSAREGEPDMLLGRPAFPSEYCATIGDVGDIILGVWSEYLEGTYQPLASAESIHVRFEYNERTFRFTLENCGRVWWRSALTPKKGATLSPFVVLAAR